MYKHIHIVLNDIICSMTHVHVFAFMKQFSNYSTIYVEQKAILKHIKTQIHSSIDI